MVDVQPLVAMQGINMRFGGVHACRDITFTVRPGEVHALLGENGAGKSTLMRILSGDLTDHSGELRIAGEPVSFSGPADAQRAGVAIIHQELDLVPGLSISENLFLGRELRTRYGTVDRRLMRERTRSLLRRTGIDLNPALPVGELRVGEQQLVTIAKALSLDAKVLIMDEPTSALAASEVRRLFDVIRELRSAGTGIVYISHRMDEIGAIADRASVLRNGAMVGSFDPTSMTTAEVVEAMVGQPAQQVFRAPQASTGEEVLRCENLALRTRRPRPGRREPDGVSLTVRSGEIVGLAGLLGAGRTELLETLFGVAPAGVLEGRISLSGTRIVPRGARSSLRRGVAFVPEDRRGSGLVLDHSILSNTALSSLDRLGRFGLVSRQRERTAAAESARELKTKLAALSDPVATLSGGNQQKVVFGKMLLTQPRLLLLDDPTRGVDVGAKAEIYQLLGQLAQRGLAVLLASSELPELLGVCDRVVVLRDGRSVADLSTDALTEADLLAAAMGERPGEPATATGAAPTAGAAPTTGTGSAPATASTEP